jgi:hypothetical protein
VLRARYRERNEANVPDVCVHILDRSEFCFVPGSLKVLYLRNVGCVRVRRKVYGQMCLPSFGYHPGGSSFVQKSYCETSCCQTAGSAVRPVEHEGRFASHFLGLLSWREIFSPSRQSKHYLKRLRSEAEDTGARRHIPTFLAMRRSHPLSFAAQHHAQPCPVCLTMTSWEPALARLLREENCPGQ